MTPNPLIDLSTAAVIARVEPLIVKLWCIRYGIGRDTDGEWRISRVGLQQVMRAQIRRVA